MQGAFRTRTKSSTRDSGDPVSPTGGGAEPTPRSWHRVVAGTAFATAEPESALAQPRATFGGSDRAERDAAQPGATWLSAGFTRVVCGSATREEVRGTHSPEAIDRMVARPYPPLAMGFEAP